MHRYDFSVILNVKGTFNASSSEDACSQFRNALASTNHKMIDMSVRTSKNIICASNAVDIGIYICTVEAMVRGYIHGYNVNKCLCKFYKYLMKTKGKELDASNVNHTRIKVDTIHDTPYHI